MFEKYLKEKKIEVDKITEEEYYKHMSIYTSLPLKENLKLKDLNPEYIREKFNEKFIKQYSFLPLYETETEMKIAVSSANNYELINELKLYYQKPISKTLVPRNKLKSLISEIYDKQNVISNLNNMETEEKKNEKLVNLDEELSDVKATKKFLNSMISDAIMQRASDIHVDPQDENIKIKFRIDGDVSIYETLKIESLASIITTIKIFCKLDVAEKRKPQSGQFTIAQNGQEINIRVEIMNSIYGEKSTLRILNGATGITSIEDLRLSKVTEDKLRTTIKKTKGIMLVTGATGSGKSTTLQAVLRTINDGLITTITIEDPVENKIDGIVQTEVNPKAGVTFASGLRSILRLDPDVIMIGEIRDEETAEIAVRAAITGHMVYATLHTNSAINTIARLKDMGIERYLLADSIEGIVNQTLIKKVCKHCKEEVVLEKDSPFRKIFNIDKDEEIVYNTGKGCEKCRKTGYSGRILLSEALLITEEVRELITSDKKINEHPEILKKQNFKTLKDDALRNVLEGNTDFKEIAFF